MFSLCFLRRVGFFACFVAYVASLFGQTPSADQRERDDAASFLRSVAATIYKLAWPTATYRQIEFGGFQRDADGLAVVIKLSGNGLFEDDLWLKLGIIISRDGIKDVKVLGHDASFAGPFETTRAMGNLMAELARQYSSNEASRNNPTMPYVGKYPFELLKNEPDLERRLHAMVGPDYSFFMDRLETQIPFKDDGGVLVASGCKAHECGSEDAIILIDTADGKLHGAILSDSYGGKIKTFSEDPYHFPSAALKHTLSDLIN